MGTAGQTTKTITMTGAAKFFRVSDNANPEYEKAKAFLGLSYSDHAVFPPDTMGAVGRDHFIEFLNGTIAAFSKTRANELASECERLAAPNEIALSGVFFGLPGHNLRDPRILYDHHSDFWVATALDTTDMRLVFAVRDATSGGAVLDRSRWLFGNYPLGAGAWDFDTLGLDDNGIYVCIVNRMGQYPHQNSNYLIIGLKKPEIYNGTAFPATKLVTTDLPPGVKQWLRIQPAVNFDPVAGDGAAWFLAKSGSTTSPYRGGAVYYRRMKWASNTSLEWTDASWGEVAANSNSNYRTYSDLDDAEAGEMGTIHAPQAPQTGGNDNDKVLLTGVFGVGSDLTMAVIRDGVLWTCQPVGLDADGVFEGDDSVSRVGIQWLRLPIVNGLLTYGRHGRIWDTSGTHPYWYYFPSVMVNCRGDAVVGFYGSKETAHISAFFSWINAGSSSAAPPVMLKPGEGYYWDGDPAFRWGDYSYTCLDPTDSLTFWTVQEYAQCINAPPLGRWGTVIGQIRRKP